MRFSFFATPTTLKKLNSPELPKVLLAGGFNGYWNFGDILMLQGVVRWHRARQESAVVASLHELGRVTDPQSLKQLPSVLGTEDFVFFSGAPWEEADRSARSLGLEPVSPLLLRGPCRLHVYGGGYFNGRWGDSMLELIETVLRAWLPGHYVLSGLQVGPEFAGRLAAHARQWQPALIGCRDPESTEALVACGLEARLSGDDALEELDRAGAQASRGEPRTPGAGRFALHMNLSTYVYTNVGEDPALMPTPTTLMNGQLQALRARFGEDASPVVLNAYIDERPVVEDSVAAMRKTSFPEYFPRADVIDLVGLLFQGRLHQAVEQIQQGEVLFASSYHVTLLGKVAGVPTHLFAFNDYYRQKKAGLAETEGSLAEFLASDWSQSLARGTEYIESQRALRREWLERLAVSLELPTPDVSWVSRASLWMEDFRQELQQARLQRAEDAQAAQAAAREAEMRHQALLERGEATEARLRELEQQRTRWEAEQLELHTLRARLAAREEEREELFSLREQLAAREQELRAFAEREEELRASYEALLTTEPPLRHRLVDDLNDRLIKAGGPRAHRAIKQLVRATVKRGK
ncbi:hypothetical protein [Myxococcus sp. CA040A]|uniref:hypothetical protein n=1 Tax=Myxococcus sp. CA040A TaxID=2741738 RepID=UPI00157A27A1|nr:hypothetical protein [Myxococcus sp. CA040A]NTX03776.1 hypothetical protein [Myxococcus sp. CA040A]